MRVPRFVLWGVLILAGALVLSPVIALLEPAELPGDFAINVGNFHLIVPLAYSLGASVALALFYFFMRR